jgi:hypothetical protein
VLKYRGGLHRYIQEEMEFLDISSLGAAYRYVIKIEQKLKQKTRQFGSGNPSQQKQGKGSPNPRTKDIENMDNLRTTSRSASKEGQWKDEERYREVV